VHTHFSIARALGGPHPQNPPVRPSVQALPKNKNPNSMQEDTTTNLKLIDPDSDASITQNLPISSTIARPLNKIAGTNEVALWALQLYIVHFSKLLDSFPGASGVLFLIRLQPQDQDPITYTIPFLESLSILSPWGSLFSYNTWVCMLTFTYY
jgi:hypothetical protein